MPASVKNTEVTIQLENKLNLIGTLKAEVSASHSGDAI